MLCSGLFAIGSFDLRAGKLRLQKFISLTGKVRLI
jgi:hypothetical protein